MNFIEENEKREVKTFKSKHTISFYHALDGVKAAYQSQPNLKIITVSTIIMVILSFAFQLSQFEFLVVILTCFMVAVAEMANTAMEATVDLITSEWREEAKFAKDVTAGGVLLAVLGSIIIGLIIFIPKVIDSIKFIQ